MKLQSLTEFNRTFAGFLGTDVIAGSNRSGSESDREMIFQPGRL